VLCSALCAIPSTTKAQTADQTLPAVTVDAPREARARPAAQKPRVRSSSARQQARPPAVTSTTASAETRNVTASAALARLYQAPAGQTETTIDRSQFENRPAFSVGDVLRDSPGVSVKQGNGPRDFGISIRGSNARNSFGIRNLVIFDDGFPVTQPDGLSRSDLIDPRAYSAIDVIRGPSSALYGNYATGGALNFRTRPGGTIDGVEYGVDGGEQLPFERRRETQRLTHPFLELIARLRLRPRHGRVLGSHRCDVHDALSHFRQAAPPLQRPYPSQHTGFAGRSTPSAIPCPG